MANAHLTENSSLLHSKESIHEDSSRKLGEDVPLYSRPRQRQRWDDHQILPHVNWGDLFFDLFYVAAAYNLAVIMKQSLNLEGFFYFCCCYGPVITQWNEKLVYDGRFVPEDNLFHRGLEVLQLLVLGTAIQHIRPVEYMKYTSTYPTTFVFCLSLSVSTYMYIKRQLDVYHNVVGGEEAKHHSMNDIRRKITAIIPFAVGALWSGIDFFCANPETEDSGNMFPILFCLLGFIGEQLFSIVDTLVWLPAAGVDFKQVRVPMNVEFTLHRLGEWVMLMLGESVLSLLIVGESGGRRYYTTFYSGILTVTMMQYLYFRSQPFDADDHAMRRDRLGAFQFFYGILAYSATLILIGCSFKLILHHYLDENEVAEGHEIESDEPQYPLKESAQRIANMFSWSMAASFFFLDLMTMAHRGWKANFSRMCSNGRVRWLSTLISLFAWSLLVVTATLSLWITNLELLSLAGCAIVICQVILRTLGMRFFPVSRDAMERALRWPNITEPRSVPHKA